MVKFTCPIIYDKPLDPKPFLENGNINFKAHDVGWLVCGVMTVIATIASIWLIWKHLTYYTCPQQQRHIVRLLIMVPVYAIVSFMSYLFYHEALYYQTIRDCYEAVLVTSFFYLILAYTGDTTAEQHAVFRNLNFERWVFPLGSLKYKPEGLHFLWVMKIAVLQYAIVRPLCTFAAVGLEYFGYYCLHSWMPWFGHVWCAILISISVTVAMYCLIQLYMPVRQVVDPYKPILKFLSVKTIVFLTFWQDTLLSFLVSFDVIKDTEFFTADQIQAGINALLQCFWMMVFGFVHIKAFSYLPYRPADDKRTTLRGRALLDSLDFRDWFWEMKESTRYIAARSKGKQYTLAEDLRADRHQHLLNALGVERTANLEYEMGLEKEAMPSFWKPQPEMRFYNSHTSRSSADAYTTPPPKRSELHSRSVPPSDNRGHHVAELDKLVAELDKESYYDAGKDEEEDSLLHDHAPSLPNTKPGADKWETNNVRYAGAGQYHGAHQIVLANTPSLEYNAGGQNSSLASNGSARDYNVPVRHDWDPHSGKYMHISDTRQQSIPVLRRDDGQRHSHLQREGSAAGRWFRSQWDRVSNTLNAYDDGVHSAHEGSDTTPPRIREFAGGSWGPSSRAVAQSIPMLHDTSYCEADLNADQPEHGNAGGTTATTFIPHTDSPLSHSIQTPRDSMDAKPSRQPPDQPLPPQETQSPTQSRAMLVVQPDIPSRHPSIAPSVSTNHHAVQPRSQLESQDAQPVAPPQPLFPPAVGPKGKLFNIVLPTPLSPARYPYGQEGPAVTTPEASAVPAPDPAASLATPSIRPIHTAPCDASAAAPTASALKWALPAKSPKRDATAIKHAKSSSSSSNAVITPGGLSLSQIRAREAAEAETQMNAAVQAAARSEAEARERAQRADADQKRMLVTEQRRVSAIQQEQKRQTSTDYAPRRTAQLSPPRQANAESRIVLPAPSQLALVESEDRYRRVDEVVLSQERNSALSIPSALMPSNGGHSTTFEVGSIISRPAVYRASGAPLKGYYSQIYHQHHREQEQQQHSSAPQHVTPQVHQYVRYHQERQSQQGVPQPSQHQQRQAQSGYYPPQHQQWLPRQPARYTSPQRASPYQQQHTVSGLLPQHHTPQRYDPALQPMPNTYGPRDYHPYQQP